MITTTSIQVPQTDIRLKAEYFLPDASNTSLEASIPVILCHPHPLYGGDMHNNVVSALFQEFKKHNVPVIRFNFRGAGNSTGTHAGGFGEIDDVKVVVEEFCRMVKQNRAFIAAYSFGAAVGAVAAAEMAMVIGYAAIAMPFDMFPEHARRMNCKKPKLFVQGTEDNVANYSRLHVNAKKLSDPVEFREIRGADHFFAGESQRAAGYVWQFYYACLKRDK